MQGLGQMSFKQSCLNPNGAQKNLKLYLHRSFYLIEVQELINIYTSTSLFSPLFVAILKAFDFLLKDIVGKVRQETLVLFSLLMFAHKNSPFEIFFSDGGLSERTKAQGAGDTSKCAYL